MLATVAEGEQRRRPPLPAVVLQKLVAGDEGATGAERDHETVEHPVSHAPEPASLLGPARQASRESAVIRVLFREFFFNAVFVKSLETT